jgi:hypothetical protein
MNANEPVSLTLTVGVAEWRKIITLLEHYGSYEIWNSASALKRQLDEIVAAVDAKEKA